MVPGFGAELVVRQLTLAGQKAKGIWLDDRAPPPGLGTERAVALGGAFTQIDIRLIADCSAMATSYVCFRVRTSIAADAVHNTNIALIAEATLAFWHP